MSPVEVAVVGVAIVSFALVSMRTEHWPLTMPMVFVALGGVAAGFDAIEIQVEIEAIGLLAEITLAVILFSDAVRIDLRRLRKFLALPARLLGIGLPLTILLGTAVNVVLFPDLPLAQVALLAAILAPTDAALGAAVVEDEAVPARDRLALNVESGLNDGMVVPVVTVLTAISIEEQRSGGGWIGFTAQQIGFGVLLGLAVGISGIVLLQAAHRRGWSDGRYEQLAVFSLPIIALFGAEAVGGNSFIAAFVAGLAFGSWGDRRRVEAESGDDVDVEADAVTSGEAPTPASFGEFTEDAAQLLAIGAFFVFGNVLLGQVVDDVSVAVVACAVLTLTIGRMLPVWIATIGTGLHWRSRVFLGWFGPRGLASIVFGLILLEDFEALPGGGDELFGVIGVTVAASVALHGASAAWGARRYGRWAAEATMDAEDRAAMAMGDEMSEVDLPRSRFALRR